MDLSSIRVGIGERLLSSPRPRCVWFFCVHVPEFDSFVGYSMNV